MTFVAVENFGWGSRTSCSTRSGKLALPTKLPPVKVLFVAFPIGEGSERVLFWLAMVAFAWLAVGLALSLVVDPASAGGATSAGTGDAR